MKVRIDGKHISGHSYKGLGVQWDPYTLFPLTDAEWERVCERLEFMAPSFVRLMIYAPSYCKGFEEDGSPIYDFEGEKTKELLRELDYLEVHGIETIFGEWEAPGRFGGAFEGITADHPQWAKIIGGLLDFLLNKKGYTCIKFYNYVNEVNGDWSFCGDYDVWRSGIIFLDQEIRKYGLEEKIKIIGPDTVWDEGNQWLHRLRKDEKLSGIIGLYDVHMYPTMEEIKSGSVGAQVREQRSIVEGKDFYMTEVGMVTGKTDGDSQPYVKEYIYGVLMADVVCQVVNGGLSGLAIWDLDDAMHNQGNGFPPEDIRSLKQWGFWNSVAGRVFKKPEEEEIRPHFYTWSLMSRLFGRTFEVLVPEYMEEQDKMLRLLAMRSSDGKQMALMLVNLEDTKETVDIQIDNFDTAGREFYKYVYNRQFRPVNEKGFPAAAEKVHGTKGKMTLEIPGESVVFFSTELI